MSLVTLVLGIQLLVLGIAGYVLTGSAHPTALIPAYAGGAFVVLAVLAIAMPKARKHFMHVAAMLSLLGVIGTVTGAIGLFKWMAGTATPQPPAVVSKSVMCGLCLLFLFMCVESFRAARRAPKT